MTCVNFDCVIAQCWTQAVMCEKQIVEFPGWVDQIFAMFLFFCLHIHRVIIVLWKNTESTSDRKGFSWQKREKDLVPWNRNGGETPFWWRVGFSGAQRHHYSAFFTFLLRAPSPSSSLDLTGVAGAAGAWWWWSSSGPARVEPKST